ncbi:hypothetical protein [Candidatus Uabimicrobium amorphum]|uniref:Uncharacterized protein n=1 Tax=Uabimicrobium amorphum TaxID=2596890 RepID=A0A5S9F6N9_UABAM|nr:hypothetical protein [Candidatus Uabimicrobium amorphum]BBM86889.1 hypothetical protein UABAM_05291 [Candidatus Uabimicrobium amorphum]
MRRQRQTRYYVDLLILKGREKYNIPAILLLPTPVLFFFYVILQGEAEAKVNPVIILFVMMFLLLVLAFRKSHQIKREDQEYFAKLKKKRINSK